MRLRVHVDTNDLEGKLDRFARNLPDAGRRIVEDVATYGQRLAGAYAPARLGWLESGITHRRLSQYEEIVHVREGMPVENANRAGGPGRGGGYGFFQEHGAYDYRNPFMEPAAEGLNSGLAEFIASERVYIAKTESGL